tara:strand:- start:695 stop:913 length:219 start_codon:yes stop_codon:yes gene_type:complete
MKKVIKDLEDRLDDLESENQELKNRLDDIEGSLPKENFYKTCAIGSEQLWQVVFNDILKQEVPAGVDLRELV